MNWDDLRIFCIAAREPTMTDAAKRLRMSVSTVSRRIEALESAAGLTLFNRSPGGIELTHHGQALRRKAENAIGAIEEVDGLIAGLRVGVWPEPIRVSAIETVIAEILAPALPKLLDAAPGIRVDLVVSNEIVNLSAREAEIAIRIAPPGGPNLVARKLPAIPMGLYTSHTYLAGRAPQALPLSEARFLTYEDQPGRLQENRWLIETGFAGNVVVRMSTTRGLIKAVMAGAGVAVLPMRMAESAGLVQLPAPLPIGDRTAWVVTHRDLAKAEPLKAVRDWIVAAFKERQSR